MRYRFQNRGQVFELSIERQGEVYQVATDGKLISFEVLDIQPGQLSLSSNGRSITLYWAADGDGKWISFDGCTYFLEKPAARVTRQLDEPAGSEMVRAPMPAQVRAIQTTQGEQVEKGQTLLLLEAMKMEIRIKAPVVGRVARLMVSDGQAVEKEQLLVEIERT
jgi:acetyl/propionyl-CoA carboxylase alpha subunit